MRKLSILMLIMLLVMVSGTAAAQTIVVWDREAQTEQVVALFNEK